VQVKAAAVGEFLVTVPGSPAFQPETGEGTQANLVVKHRIYLPLPRSN